MFDREQFNTSSHAGEEDNKTDETDGMDGMDETIKVARIQKKVPPLNDEVSSSAPGDSETPFINEQEEELRESLSILATHLMPIAPRVPSQERVTSGILSPVTLLERMWRFSPVLFLTIVLAPFIGGGVLEAAQLNQARHNLYQVDARSGSIRWQQAITTPTHIESTDIQGSLLDVTLSSHMHQLVAVDLNGAIQWRSFSSQASFSLPGVSSRPGTVLVSLGEHGPGDALAYQSLSLYLLNRATGQSIWQSSIVEPGSAQSATILGADAQFIYIVLAPMILPGNGGRPLIQLLAISQESGNIAWHTVPIVHAVHTSDANDLLYDAGKVLVRQDHLFWQVGGTIYDIDTATGKIHWSQFLQEDTSQTLLHEEAKMVEVADVVLVGRSYSYHALDLASGNERWVVPNPGVDPGIAQQSRDSAWGIAASGTTILVYGNGQIQAIDAASQQLIWSLKQLNAIENLHISDDGRLVYVTVSDSIEGSPATQGLVALDMKNGAVRWTFQPFEATMYVPLAPDGFIYQHTILLTLVCQSSPQKACTLERLYALNASTGAELWQYEGNSIADVHLSTDDGRVVFQNNSSGWQDLTARFRN
jgi:outer membrane protein assembly factor BamB